MPKAGPIAGRVSGAHLDETCAAWAGFDFSKERKALVAVQGTHAATVCAERIMAEEPIVAIALLTQTNLKMLKGSLKRVFPIAQDNTFDALLKALDEAGVQPGPGKARPK